MDPRWTTPRHSMQQRPSFVSMLDTWRRQARGAGQLRGPVGRFFTPGPLPPGNLPLMRIAKSRLLATNGRPEGTAATNNNSAEVGQAALEKSALWLGPREVASSPVSGPGLIRAAEAAQQLAPR